MADRTNLCKVSPELRDRHDALRGGRSWPEYQRRLADLLEQGVRVRVHRYGQDETETHTLGLDESTEVVSDLLRVTVSTRDRSYTCDECGENYPLTKVLQDGDKTICGACLSPGDRILTEENV